MQNKAPDVTKGKDYDPSLFTHIKVKKNKDPRLNKDAQKLKSKYKMHTAKQNIQQNLSWNPKAQVIRDSCVEDWDNYASSMAYTTTGRIAYVSPKSMLDVVDFYDPYDLPDDSISVTVVGKRRTGKSYLVKDLCKKWGMELRRFDEIYVFTKTAINEWYQEWVPQEYVYDGWDSEKAELIWARAMWKTWMKKHHNVGRGAKILVICDDLLSDSATHKYDPTLLAFYTAGRHVGISVIYITQKFKGTIPAIRDNTDIVFSFNMFNQNESRQLSEEFLGGLNLRTAMELQDLYANQEQHTCLVVETWRNNRDPAVYLKFYQAENSDDLKTGDIGSKEYIRIAAELQAKREQEEDEARSRPVDYPVREDWEVGAQGGSSGDGDTAAALFRHLSNFSRS